MKPTRRPPQQEPSRTLPDVLGATDQLNLFPASGKSPQTSLAWLQLHRPVFGIFFGTTAKFLCFAEAIKLM